MYAETLFRYAADRRGAVQRVAAQVGSGTSRRAAVIAVLENDADEPWLVVGREDRAEGTARPHIMRLLVSRIDQVEGDEDDRREVYERIVSAVSEGRASVDVVAAYHMEGGRELKAFLECRPFESKGEEIETDWIGELREEFAAYHAAKQSAEEAREAVLAYVTAATAPSDEDRSTVEAYATSEVSATEVVTSDSETDAVLERYAASAAPLDREVSDEAESEEARAILARYAALAAE